MTRHTRASSSRAFFILARESIRVFREFSSIASKVVILWIATAGSSYGSFHFRF